jgi:hypothetical protein
MQPPADIRLPERQVNFESPPILSTSKYHQRHSLVNIIVRTGGEHFANAKAATGA